MKGSRTIVGEEILGTFGVVSATHWIPAQVAMAILEQGGNAFDAAAAAGLVFHVVDPHMNGIGGEAVILARKAGDALPLVICGQGTAPGRATIDAYRERGFELIPEDGVMSAVVPGAFGAWMTLLERWGTKRPREILAPAISYATDGFPLSHDTARYIRTHAKKLRIRWSGAAPIYLPDNTIPAPGAILRNVALGQCLNRILTEAEAAASTRDGQIEAARSAFYSGFVAEAIGRFLRGHVDVEPGSGREHRAFLSEDDLASWRATIEEPVSATFRDWTLFKPGPWSQGPVLLQLLSILEDDDLGSGGLYSLELIHLITEASKLAFADREAWYGDPDFVNVPLAALLDKDYSRSRRGRITEIASDQLCPGAVAGRPFHLPEFRKGRTEPNATRDKSERDTCHINIIDRWHNVAAVTLSGGWFYSSPTIPELGFSLSTRGQMFWLQDGLASTLRPKARPRTTLTPTMAIGPNDATLAFGCRGADHSDQWLAQFFLQFAGQRMDLRSSVDAPVFGSEHWPNSVYPRTAYPKRLMVDPIATGQLENALAQRGHQVMIVGKDRIGRTCAAIACEGLLRAAATRRLKQSVAIGR